MSRKIIPIKAIDKAINKLKKTRENPTSILNCGICAAVECIRSEYENCAEKCPLHPKWCCSDRLAHKQLPVYWQYRDALLNKDYNLAKKFLTSMMKKLQRMKEKTKQ